MKPGSLDEIARDMAADLRRHKGEGRFRVDLPAGGALKIDVLPNDASTWTVRVEWPDGQDICEVVAPRYFLRILPAFLRACMKEKKPETVPLQ